MTTLSPRKINIFDSKLAVTANSSGWKTILFNCDCHTTYEVMHQLVIALKCNLDTARAIMNTAEQTGQAVVCEGTEEYCNKVATILGSTGLVVTVME